MQPQDHRARERALDPNHSFAVTAPAGSGKTGLLTQRVLKLLPLCESPEEVVCITFTRKAAAEMQERIAQAIQHAASTPRPESEHEQKTWDLAKRVIEHDQEKNWQLLKNTGRLRVQTIDGLCRSLTQYNPVESGIGGRSQLLEHPKKIYRRAVENALASIESDGQIQHDLRELYLHLDNNLETVIELLINLLSRRDQWLLPLLSARDARQYLEGVLKELTQECLNELSQLLWQHASELSALADYAGSNCLEDKPESNLCQLSGCDALPESEPDELERWRLITDFLLTATGDWRSSKGLNKNVGFPAGTDKDSKIAAKARKTSMAELLAELKAIPNLLEQLRLVRTLPPCHYPHQQWRLLDGLTRIMPHAVMHLKLAFRSLNATDFSEVTQGALLALGDADNPSELTMKLDYQIKHILVDEFQDTASPQLQLLERLTSGWQQGDGRSLFIVGDGMQSCYGFRDANVGIFLDARANGIGDIHLENLDLCVNFRSQSGIVDWVNTAFETAFPLADDISRGAVRYSPSVGFKPTLESAGVKTHVIVNGSDRLAEANKVVELVQQALADAPEDRVAILARNRPHLADILIALQKNGIEWQATDIDPLANRMAVQDLISLTRAMLFPSDHNAWLAVLRCPIIGLDNFDLHTLVNLTPTQNEQKLCLFERVLDSNIHQHLSKDAQLIMKRCAPLLRAAWDNRRRKGLRFWLEGLWVALGGPASLADSSDANNAQDYFSLLERYDDGGTIDEWEEFSTAIRLLYARPSEKADPRVQVMTIHKSKGLEFETVIIPGLDKLQRSDDKQLILWMERINQDHEKQLMLGPLAATGESDDPLYQFLRNEQKIKSSLEATRLLYVGCTRAINRLHLLANVKFDEKKDTLKAPANASLLAPLWPSIKDSVNEIRPLQNAKALTPKGPIGMIRRLPPQWQRAALIPSSLLAAFRGREFDDDENLVGDDYFRHRTARHTGTVLHRCLAQIAQEGTEVWDAARLKRQSSYWAAQLRGLGVHGQALNDALNKIELGLLRTLADNNGQWLLNPNHEASACELNLWSNGKNKVRNSIIDRTFIDNGTRWIIDYKSSEPSAEQSREEFLTQEIAHYRDQLDRYTQLFDSEDQPVKSALYFPLMSHLEVV
ncbi:MAG: UvrD-helicase domain-containing protein [Cellvibrionaceae bacterium]